MKRQIQQGFTLIELMVVIVIIGILSAIAIPAFIDNSIRAKVTEGINLFAPAKASIAEAYISSGDMPTDQNSAGMGVPGSYSTDIVQDITYTRVNDDAAEVQIAYEDIGGDTAAGDVLIYTGVGSSSGVTWYCKQGNRNTLDQKYLPANCRGAAPTTSPPASPPASPPGPVNPPGL